MSCIPEDLGVKVEVPLRIRQPELITSCGGICGNCYHLVTVSNTVTPFLGFQRVNAGSQGCTEARCGKLKWNRALQLKRPQRIK